MTVGELKSESIAADDRHVIKREILGDAFSAKYLFASPFIDARRTRTTSSKLCGGVLTFGIVRPFDRDQTVGLFNNLRGFDTDGYNPW